MASSRTTGAPEIVPTAVDRVLNWARQHSLRLLPLGPACCAAEVMAAFAPRHDLARFGVEGVRCAPYQADLLLVAGRISLKMAPALRRTYAEMPEPKWVMAVGACACSGGVFDTYAVVQGVDQLVPVDVYVPGCPPRPEDLIDGLNLLQKKIAREVRA